MDHIAFIEERMATNTPFAFTASGHEREMVDHLRKAGWRVEQGMDITDFAWYCYPPHASSSRPMSSLTTSDRT